LTIARKHGNNCVSAVLLVAGTPDEGRVQGYDGLLLPLVTVKRDVSYNEFSRTNHAEYKSILASERHSEFGSW